VVIEKRCGSETGDAAAALLGVGPAAIRCGVRRDVYYRIGTPLLS
jgi:hypothetical protein